MYRIISGGQTGIDRGALDAALVLNFPCGGWCPTGRLAEDGVIDARYPLQELDHGGYIKRTLRNVAYSDGTAILYFGKPEGGTAQTIAACTKRGKPFKLIDAHELTPDRAAMALYSFVSEHAIGILNVAGPRLSKQPRAHQYAFETISKLIGAIRRGG